MKPETRYDGFVFAPVLEGERVDESIKFNIITAIRRAGVSICFMRGESSEVRHADHEHCGHDFATVCPKCQTAEVWPVL